MGTQKVDSSTAAPQEHPQPHFFKFHLQKEEPLCTYYDIGSNVTSLPNFVPE